MPQVHHLVEPDSPSSTAAVSNRPVCPSPGSDDQPQIGHLRLLGGFELSLSEGVASPSPTCQRILAFLALRDRPTTRSYIAGNLWPDCSERKAAGSLRSALWRLNKMRRNLICCSSSALSLNEAVSVDTNLLVDESKRLVENGGAGDGCRIDIELFSRDLLPDWYDDWVYFERERLRHLRLASLERLAVGRLEQGDHLGAIHAADAAIAGEPLRESAHRILIQVHFAQGNYCEAIGQYRIYVRLLDGALGLKPSPLMDALIAPLMTG